MISFIVGFLVGGITAALVFKNNILKASKLIDEAEAESNEIKVKGKAALDALKGKK